MAVELSPVRIVIQYESRTVALDGQTFRLLGSRIGGYRVQHANGFDVGKFRIEPDAVTWDNGIVETLVRAWLLHCLENELDPWPQPARG